eukprot:TRINITY_DN6121_c0_g4_i3.p1 TRINITY_DN6121_c0_g4~~TRINITY_DN6121_c0_g4_i3.p1  ORF type:complete len:150 (+),score=25.33 TRINITY_DN6121_c0_g4_i3:204-653(+)
MFQVWIQGIWTSKPTHHVLMCLVQLLVDPFYRTYVGFCTLLDKEWCAFGHTFPDVGSTACPSFFLFLHCVWMLQQKEIHEFEFSANLLDFFMDATSNSRFENFLFSNDSVRRKNMEISGLVGTSIFHYLIKMKESFLNIPVLCVDTTAS